MLRIKCSVYRELEQTFLLDTYEQGCILGSKEHFNSIDCCKLIPASQSGDFFYVPDNCVADFAIREWADEGICLSGFIHSHTKGQMDFSEDDILFASQLLNSYRVPYLWFGLGIVTTGKEVEMRFYQILKKDAELVLNPAVVQIV